jgi:hypothetical protein
MITTTLSVESGQPHFEGPAAGDDGEVGDVVRQQGPLFIAAPPQAASVLWSSWMRT